MKTLKLFIAGLALIVFNSCGSVRSTTQHGIDLNNYRSFTIADNGGNYLPQLSPVQKSQIENAIVKEIKSISPDNLGVTGADVLVNYFVVVDNKQDIETYTNYYGRRWRNRIIDVDVREYKEGTLIIDFIDAKTQHVIWHGSTSSTVTNNSIELEKKINQAVNSLFEKFKKDKTPKS